MVTKRIQNAWDKLPISNASVTRRERERAQSLIQRYFGLGALALGRARVDGFSSLSAKPLAKLTEANRDAIVAQIEKLGGGKRILISLSLSRSDDVESLRVHCRERDRPTLIQFDDFLERTAIGGIRSATLNGEEYWMVRNHFLRDYRAPSQPDMLHLVFAVAGGGEALAVHDTVDRSYRKLAEIALMGSFTGHLEQVTAANMLKEVFESGTPVLGFNQRGSIVVLTL